MLTKEEFIQISSELNLFFQRIMKEHLYFITLNLPPVAADDIRKAKSQKEAFAQLLQESICYAQGTLSHKAIQSQEMVTPYTFTAEEVTATLTGAAIPTALTKAELLFSKPNNCPKEDNLYESLHDLNYRTLCLLQETIAFQKEIEHKVEECQIFFAMYPEMLHHIIKEAEHYYHLLAQIQKHSELQQTIEKDLQFWNHIMQEHAGFIAGLLDPSEHDLKKTAHTLQQDFRTIQQDAKEYNQAQMIQKSFAATQTIQNFKTAATEELLECEIKSIIPPLLADHILREANHYLKLLVMWQNPQRNASC